MSPTIKNYSPAVTSSSKFFNKFFRLPMNEAELMGMHAVRVLSQRDNGSFGKDILDILKVLNYQRIDPDFELFYSFIQLVDSAYALDEGELRQIENGMHPVLTELGLAPYGLAETQYELSVA